MKGLDAHLTAGPPESPDPTHWHVSRHRDDEDVFITPDIYSALDYAATELRERAEFEWEGIEPSGEAGDFEGAYNAWKRSQELDALYQSAVHPCQQYSRTDPDEDERYDANKHRAPLYQGYGGDDKLTDLAKRMAAKVNDESEISIWECSDELVYLNDNGTAESDEDNGFPYHLGDWEPGYQGRFTRGPEPAAMTDR